MAWAHPYQMAWAHPYQMAWAHLRLVVLLRQMAWVHLRVSVPVDDLGFPVAAVVAVSPGFSQVISGILRLLIAG